MKPLFSFIPDQVPEDLKGLIKSIPEEIANMISHAIGLVIFIIGTPLLIAKSFESGSGWFIIGSAIFCISLLMVYSSSTIYHSIYKLALKKRLRIFDHISIYFLITGSFTPFILVHVQTSTGWLIFGVLWTAVLVGSVFKYFFTHKYNLVSTLAYVAMGGMAFFIMEPLHALLSAESLMWLGIGGASYLIGVIFYLWKTLYFNHLIWHLFVLLGSFSHFMAVWNLA